MAVSIWLSRITSLEDVSWGRAPLALSLLAPWLTRYWSSSFTYWIYLKKPKIVLHPRPWFNIKMSSYQYRKYHCGDKTVVRSSYLHNGISYTGKMTYLYWIRAQERCPFIEMNYWYFFIQLYIFFYYISFLPSAIGRTHRDCHEDVTTGAPWCQCFTVDSTAVPGMHANLNANNLLGDHEYRKISNIRCIKSQNLNDSRLVLLLTLPNPLKPSGEWRCSWNSADRRCSNYIWVIDNFIAF